MPTSNQPLPTIDGYRVQDRICESDHSVVYRATRSADDRSVILKFLKEDYPPPEELTRYRQEFALTSSLSLEGVVKAHALETHNQSPVIVLEDFGGDSLRIVMDRAAIPLADVLSHAIQVAACLGQLHRERVIHKDINPSNIVLNAESGEIKLIDLGISTRLPFEEPSLSSPDMLGGTLAYMSPEQTGRMNRSVDYRTDFYSLGVTLYELLAGRLPFVESDALALVHCHIAKQPEPLVALDSRIPATVSDIVARLMHKNAEDRYQSAQGIRSDLAECLDQLQRTGRIEPFPLARHDVSGRFQIPEKMYGREAEIRALLAAFDRVSTERGMGTSSAELIMVAGYSGIGKTALVRELHKPLTRQRGLFIAGKFDQFQRGVPYSAVAEAFSDLVRQLLTESGGELATWKQEIRTAVGPNGRLITDVVPEVELIIGPQPEVEELGATESQNRFNLVFQSFVRVFCRPGRPLVIFLDDLQWADTASLKLMAMVMRDSETRHLLLLGAYRDNQVSPTHPLMMMLESLAGEATVSQIKLKPLGIEHVTALIAATVSESPGAVGPLASLVHTKTAGNPFFVKQFLTSLYSEHLLRFTPDGWQWDIPEIEQVGITDNVVDLMVRKLKKLPAGTQRALRLAACIGNRFDLETLALVSEAPEAQVSAELESALQETMILPSARTTQAAGEHVAAGVLITDFKFLHDRVQQAAYGFIDEDERRAVHLTIGRRLWKNAAAGELESRLFDVIEHLNLGADLITDPAERRALAQLNLDAAKRARHAMADQPALDSLEAGLRLLEDDSWESDYALTFDLHVNTVEARYLTGRIDEARALSERIRSRADGVLDTIKVYELQMMSSVAQNDHLASIATAREALGLLGLEIPTEPGDLDAMVESLRRELAEKVTDIAALEHLPEMTDPTELAKLRILSSMSAPAYNASPELLPAIIFSQTRLCVEHGNAPMACVAYVWHAIIVGGIYGDLDSAYQFGLLAVRLQEKFHATEFKAKICNLFNAFVRQWNEHLKETMAPMVEGFQSGMETGDTEFGLYSAIQYSNNLLFIGEPLDFVCREREKYRALTVRLRQNYHQDYFSVGNQFVMNLLGQSDDPRLLVGEVLDERTRLPQWEADHNVTFSFMAYSCKSILCYLFKDYAQAVEMARHAARYERGGTGLYYGAMQVFYHALALLARCDDVDADTRHDYLAQVSAHQARLAAWAERAPMNFRNKLDLVAAERARVEGDQLEAMAAYERAIAGAREEGFIQEDALACERCAEFYLALGRDEIARLYMTRAHYGYGRWQAHAKVRELETSHPLLVSRPERVGDTGTIRTRTTSTGRHSRAALDIATVLKASQAISGELVLDTLLERVLEIIMESAGADRGALIIERDGELRAEAMGSIADGVTVLESVPVVGHRELAVSVIQYVARSAETVVLDDAAAGGRFRDDPYVAERRPRSMLCAPIIRQSRRIGIIYLENHSVAGAFSPRHLDVLEVLSVQAAISLENARLYDTLEQKVERRTRELAEKNEALEAKHQQILHTQAQLVHSEKMASLGQLTAGVAHEINNPLNFVNNFAVLGDQLIDEVVTASEQDPAVRVADVIDTLTDLKSNLGAINKHGKRATAIVASMLQHARGTTGEREVVDLNAFVGQYINLAKFGARREDDTPVAVDLQFDDAAGQVEILPQEFGQVLVNLLNNAFDAVRDRRRQDSSFQDGKVTVETRRSDELVEVRVSDNGVGVPPAIRDKIFEPFFTTKSGKEGTGLGLSLCYEIMVQGHRGALSVDSAPGQGTTFVASLPVKAPADDPSAPESQ